MNTTLGKKCSTEIFQEARAGEAAINGYTTNLNFFKDATAFEPTDRPSGNPYYWWTVLYTGLGMSISKSLAIDPDVDGTFMGDAGGVIVMVACNYTVYDVTYSSVNSSVTNWTAHLSNSTVIDFSMLEIPYARSTSRT